MKQDPTLTEARALEDIRTGTMLKIDVATEGGQKLLQLTEALLGERLATLAQGDGYCQGLLEVLQQTGYNIRLAAEKSALMLRQQAMGE